MFLSPVGAGPSIQPGTGVLGCLPGPCRCSSFSHLRLGELSLVQHPPTYGSHTCHYPHFTDGKTEGALSLWLEPRAQPLQQVSGSWRDSGSKHGLSQLRPVSRLVEEAGLLLQMLM